MARRIETLVLAAALVLFGVGAYRLVSLPDEEFASSVIVDDALYFLVPARHFVEGKGFSFDGVYVTNGVQTLWAVVTVGIAWLVRDTMAAMRAMCFVSGACWLLAGLLLYGSLRRHHQRVALFVACGFLMAAFTQRVAFQGMENGLCALLSACVFAAGLRAFGDVDAGERRIVPYVRLGTLVALLSSSRSDYVLLPVMLCVAVFSGLLGVATRDRRLYWAEAFRFGLPVLVLLGGTLLFSWMWCGSFMPVSGRVKLFYESEWGASLHGSWLESLAWHGRFVHRLALGALSDNTSALLQWCGLPVAGTTIRKPLLAMYGLGVAYVVVRLWRSGGCRRPSLRCRYSAILVVFAVAHGLMMVTLLPHFTPYCTWYFAVETLGIWTCAGWLLLSAFEALAALVAKVSRPVARCTVPSFRIGAPVLVVAVAVVPVLGSSPVEDPRAHRFLQASRWLNAELPPGQKVGALSAGLVGAFADRHTVYNLDGLVSSTEYFEEFLRPNRVHAFIDREQIAYFADYQPLSTWAVGITWCGLIPLSRLRLQRWWRFDGDTAYAIWEILPQGRTHELLAPGTGRGVDRLAELRFAAEALGRFELLPEDAVPELRADGAGRVVVASIPFEPSGKLRHIVVSRARLATAPLPVAGTRPALRVRLRLTGGTELYGVELHRARVRAGDRVVVTRFWRRRELGADPEAIRTTIHPEPDGAPIAEHVDALRHGTHRETDWRPDQAVVDSCVLQVPERAQRGDYAVRIAGTEVARITVR